MIIWISFIGFVVLALVLDLGVFNRNPHVIQTKEAAIWSSIWVFCALEFAGVIYLSFQNEWIENPTFLTPYEAVVNFVSGYIIELTQSVVIIFVIALIFITIRI